MSFTQKKASRIIVALMLLALAVFSILHLDRINYWLGYVAYLLRPVLIGLCIAYLCNPIFRMFEHKLLFNVHPDGLRRVLSLICTYIMLFLIFFALIMLIVPQLIASILDFFNNYESFLKNALENVNGLITSLNDSFSYSLPTLVYEDILEQVDGLLSNLDLQGFLDDLLTYSNITTLLTALNDVFFIVVDVIFGLVISIYILNSKEKRYAQIMRLRRAIFGDTLNRRITEICEVADRSFGGFLRGKLLDSTIVGILVYIIISIMQVPYAVLIAVIIGITDIVPVIGPFIGVIPSAIIILLTDPIKVIPFLLCILIVQQIDGNILAPKILGDNTGVSSLCVMIAITVMGSIWGLFGMVLGVPLFATVLELTDRYLKKKLKEKGLPAGTEHYYGKQTEVAIEKSIAKKKRKQASDGITRTCGGKGDLTQYELDALKAYTLVRKHGLDSDRSADALASFHTEYESEENK
ncbi:MAG: AI-2E family transporter [Clostridia bacterium]|nr:AI-2E family transporter [Clostridia bacterium]